MNLYISLALIIVACISSPVVTQRWARQQQQQQQQQQRQSQGKYIKLCLEFGNKFAKKKSEIHKIFQSKNVS